MYSCENSVGLCYLFKGAMRLFLKLKLKERIAWKLGSLIIPDPQGDVSGYPEKVSEIKNSLRILRSFVENFLYLAIVYLHNIGN